MSVYHPENSKDCVEFCRKNFNNTIIIKYGAEWCGPCKYIAPIFENFSKTYPELCFMEIDVEKCEDYEKCQNIRSLPTFECWHKNKLYKFHTGANPDDLEEMLNYALPSGN